MARPARKALTGADMDDHRRRATAAWTERDQMDWLYQDAYRFAVPFRRPAKYAAGESRVDHLFDSTAVISTFHGAGALKEDLFPSDKPFFTLEPSPIARLMAENANRAAAAAPDNDNAQAGKQQLAKYTEQLGNLTDQVRVFFQTGEFDRATSEMCVDLYLGTGIMVPLRGDDDNPLRFITIPIDEAALEAGAFGDIDALFWKTQLTRRAIFQQWPKGAYSDEFRKALQDGAKALDKVELHQDWYRDGKVWRFVAWLEGETGQPPIVTETYRTKPFVAARYHVVPGETYGRGPVMLVMPAIKTVNKAQELTLKASAIQILGLWGYRPGGNFDPDTARVVPGGFWPMSSTGGVLGPDVSRLDPAGGNIQIGQLVRDDLQGQIKTALNDDRLPERGGATPISASEVMARMAKVRQNYVGAFGRLINDIVPVLIPRVMEILYDAGLLDTDLTAEQLFVRTKVTSPLAAMMKINHLEPLMQFLQLCGALQRNPDHFIRMDDQLAQIVADLDIESRMRRTPEERAQLQQQEAQQQQAALMAESVARNPKNAAEAVQTVAGMAEGAPQ